MEKLPTSESSACCRYKVPKGVDLVQAGGLPVAFGTSHVALVHRAHLQAGQVRDYLVFGGL